MIIIIVLEIELPVIINFSLSLLCLREKDGLTV